MRYYDSVSIHTDSALTLGLSCLQAAEAGNRNVERFASYAHSFVLFVSPKGVSIFQAWGQYGYTLQAWIQQNPAPMTFDEAKDFANEYKGFCALGVWDAHTNGVYRRLLGLDFRSVATTKQKKCVPGRIKSYTRIITMPNVSAERLKANSHLFLL